MSVMDWARWNQNAHPELELLHHCPNGVSRNKAEAVKMKQMGVKALKNCELAQRHKKFGFKEAMISSRGECTGCRNPDDGTLDRKCKRCKYNEYYEAK